MYQVSPAFLASLRTSHTLYTRLDVYQGVTPVLTDVPIIDGTVTVNSGDGVRRTLDVTVADPALWSALSPSGTELRPYRGIRYPDGSVERVPLGVFSLESQSMSLARDGGISLASCPDRWARIQRSRFPVTEVSNYSHSVRKEIARLVQGAMTRDVLVRDNATSTIRMAELIYSRDRDQEILKLLTEIAAEGFFNHAGHFVLRDVPTLRRVPVWTVDTGNRGVLTAGSTTRDRSRAYNCIVIHASNTDGAPAFPTQIVEDLNPMSETYVHGPFGRVPFFFSSPVIHNVTAALKAGRALLAKTRGSFSTIDIESVVNPALDRGDTIAVTGLNGIELHLVDSVTIPLSAEGGQQITTRVVRDVPEESST